MSPTTMNYAIETENLTKRFGRRKALDSATLAVRPGTVFGVIGPNGAGKTTMMRLLLDLIRPSSGLSRVLGVEPKQGGPNLRRRIGYLPGELRLEGRVTGNDLLAHYANISGPIEAGAVLGLADRLGLDLKPQVRQLSKGNKQKLGIVQAFMHKPDLLVLDEPTSGLDPLVQQEFLTMVREARDNGQTVFLSSHVLSEIQQAADSVAILRAGHIISISDVDTLRLTAIRRVRIGFADAPPGAIQKALSAIPQLSELVVTTEDDTRASATIEGPIDPFIKAVAKFSVTDLTVEEPDLEESVLRLYSENLAIDDAHSMRETTGEK